MRTYEAGVCHTYSPPARSKQGLENRLYFMLGKLKNKTEDPMDNYMNFNFDVYLHEKGQFWPRDDSKAFGQSQVFHLELDTQVEAVFTRSKHVTLNKPSRVFSNKLNYSLTECLREFLFNKSSCRSNWFSDHTEDNNCNKKGFIQYAKYLVWLKQAPWTLFKLKQVAFLNVGLCITPFESCQKNM